MSYITVTELLKKYSDYFAITHVGEYTFATPGGPYIIMLNDAEIEAIENRSDGYFARCKVFHTNHVTTVPLFSNVAYDFSIIEVIHKKVL